MRAVLVVCVLLSRGLNPAAGQGREEFRVDAASSSLLVHVGRTGLFAFAGHSHEIAAPAIDGHVTLDQADVSQSAVSVEFDAAAMRVTGRGEPAGDVPEVERVMRSDRVLDVERHPTITFTSRRVVELGRSAARMSLRVEGELTLRGITRPVTASVEVDRSAEGLTATGKATVRQTEFGIRPVTAGAGMVRVRDDVDVSFAIVAR